MRVTRFLAATLIVASMLPVAAMAQLAGTPPVSAAVTDQAVQALDNPELKKELKAASDEAKGHADKAAAQTKELKGQAEAAKGRADEVKGQVDQIKGLGKALGEAAGKK